MKTEKQKEELCMLKKVTLFFLNSVLLILWIPVTTYADSVSMQGYYHSNNVELQKWTIEQSGNVIVKGALLSSPCILETNEIALPLKKSVKGLQEQHLLKLTLTGCGNGGTVISSEKKSANENIVAAQSALLTGIEGGLLQLTQRMVGMNRVFLRSGENNLTYALTSGQEDTFTFLLKKNNEQGKPYINPRDHNALLRLRLDYD